VVGLPGLEPGNAGGDQEELQGRQVWQRFFPAASALDLVRYSIFSPVIFATHGHRDL